MLIEHVVFALIIERRMGLVHPYSRGNTVILRSVSVALVYRAVKRDYFPFERGVSLKIGVAVNLSYLLG